MSTSEKLSCSNPVERLNKTKTAFIFWCPILNIRLDYLTKKHCSAEEQLACQHLLAGTTLSGINFHDVSKSGKSKDHGEDLEQGHSGSDETRTYEINRFRDEE